MRIFIPRLVWIGNHYIFLHKALKANGTEVLSNTNTFNISQWIQKLKLTQISKIQQITFRNALIKYNSVLLAECVKAKPEVFLVMNESNIYPSTISEIKNRCKCLMVLLLADDPWDSTRYIADFPHSLKYFDLIFTGEPSFIVNIKRVAPDVRIYYFPGGYDPDFFYPPSFNDISDEDHKRFACEISFTGTSYGNKAEGAYRADILSYLTEFDLKIFGDNNWPYRFRYLPNLRKHFMGNRLSYNDLRKLYFLSKINLNLPAPQVLIGFQPRVFEIAACKGFQIADHRTMLKELFTEDELVTFETIGELKEKISYYLNHESERKVLIEKLYKKIHTDYTWEKMIKYVINVINQPNNFEELRGINIKVHINFSKKTF